MLTGQFRIPMVTDSHNVKYEILIYPATRQFNRKKKKKKSLKRNITLTQSPDLS